MTVYHSYHHIETLNPHSDEMHKYDVVGPVCESSDIFRKQIDIAKLQRGDKVAIYSVGAYGQVMASDYNMRNRAQSVYLQ